MLGKKTKQRMKQQFIESYRDVAAAFNSDDLPEEEKWKNDINVIADGMFDETPKSATDINKVMRYVMLSELNAETSAREMLDKQGNIDLAMPKTFIDLITSAGGMFDAMDDNLDPTRINLVHKKDVN